MISLDQIYLDKAQENLAAAASDLVNRRYNSCASRCYYACFQAAIFALTQSGIRPPGRFGEWGHDFVQAQFAGHLISRRKVYPAALRNTLAENYAVREIADYKSDHVTEVKARRALRRTEEFVRAVISKGGASR